MGSLRSKPDLEKITLVKTGEGLSFAESTMCGIDVSISGWRETNEDSHICLSPFNESKNSLFGVFDGHHGSEVSKYVQRHFAEELQKNKNYKDGKYQQALRETFMLMDVLLTSQDGREELFVFYKQSKEKSEHFGYYEKQKLKLEKAPKDWEWNAGCTANVVLITPKNIYCANSGDSRAVACVSGECFELSHDHKPTDPEELKRIGKTQWQVCDGRIDGDLNLSRAFGNPRFKKSSLPQEEQAVSANPDIIKLKNDKIDFILMGCDGIWENKSPREMVEWISKKLKEQIKKETILQHLFEEQTAKDRNGLLGHDNMSAILIEFDQK